MNYCLALRSSTLIKWHWQRDIQACTLYPALKHRHQEERLVSQGIIRNLYH